MTSLQEAAFPRKELENYYDKGRIVGISDVPESTRLYTVGPRIGEAQV